MNLSGKPSGAGADAVIVPRSYCGTAWTQWVKEPDADVNPCPRFCKRGERQVLDQHKTGDLIQYKARYACYLPELAVNQPAWVLGPLQEDGTPRKNCGTAWTGYVSDPGADVNPCPSGCERGPLQLVNRNRSADALTFAMRYQCYVAEKKNPALAAVALTRANAAPTATLADRAAGMGDLNPAGNVSSAPGPTLTRATAVAPASLLVAWNPLSGVSNYVVHAAERGGGKIDVPVTAPARLRGDMTRTLDGLTPAFSYTVWVEARYPDGRSGVSELREVSMPDPVNPANFRAARVGDQGAELTWDAVPGALRYRVEGANLPTQEVAQLKITVANLPEGTHRWHVMSVYSQGVYNDVTASTVELTIESRAAMVERAFTTGQSRHRDGGPDPDRWKRLALATTMNYDQLVNSFESLWIVTQAYQYLLERDATPQEADHYVGQLNAGRDWHQVWREVAQSAERDQRYRYWAPAPMDGVPQARLAFNQPGLRNGQACFGGVGDGCDTTFPPGVSDPVWNTGFVLPDGTRMAFVEISVAVGSILHDNACLANADGLHCDNQAWHWVAEHIPGVAAAVSPAALEWNKAWFNVADGRKWRARFGPYPVDQALRRANWFDDLRAMQSRTAYMAPVFAGFTIPSQTERYTGGETRASHALAAPPGTSLDSKDVEFCRSGRFATVGSFIGKADWGICQ